MGNINNIFIPKTAEEIKDYMYSISAYDLLQTGINMNNDYFIKVALARGAKITAIGTYKSLLKYMNKNELEQYLSTALKLRLDINVKDTTNEKRFAAAVKTKNIPKIKELLKKQVKNINFLNGEVMMIAVKENDIELVKSILKYPEYDPTRGGHLSIIYPHMKYAAIKKAAQEGKTEIVNILLKDSRIDPTSGDNWALKSAIKNNHWGIVEILLKDNRVFSSLDNIELMKIIKKLTKLIK